MSDPAITDELLAHYQTGCTTTAWLLKLIAQDDTVLGLTDHDQALTFEGLTYGTSSAADPSAISSKSELNVDNAEVNGLLDDAAVSIESVEKSRWAGAEFELLRVNWADLSMGCEIMRIGRLGDQQWDGLQFRHELRGLMYRFQNVIGRLLTPVCDRTLGDAKCQVDLEALVLTATVTAVDGGFPTRKFTAASLTQVPPYLGYGKCTWLDGDNAGRSMEVAVHAAGGVLTLLFEMPDPIQPGDAFTITPGCDKSKATCISKFNNVVNWGGFDIAGQDRVLMVGGQ